MTKSNHAQQIAQTIWNQIMYSAPNQWAVMAWGVEAKAFGTEEGAGKEPYLMLRVRGSKHKGLVKIVYHQCPDMYWIHFINKKGETKEVVDHIYCDQLFEVIDRRVEKNWRPNELN